MTSSSPLLLAFLLAAASCGDDAPIEPPPPDDPCPKADGPLEVVSIAADADYSMAVMSDGTVRCWGFNVANRCAMPDSELEVWPPRKSQGLECVTQVSLGEDGGAARRADGGLLVWSTDRHGELTQKYDVAPGVPVRIEELPSILSVQARGHTIHAVSEQGVVLRWGFLVSPKPGQFVNQWEIAPVEGLPPVATVARGGAVCAAGRDASLWCWGANDYGQLGDGTVASRLEPRQVAGLEVQGTAVGSAPTACALLKNQEVWCWGRNDAGQAGQPAAPGEELEEKVLLPRRVEGLPPVVQMDLNDAATCAVTVDSEVYCWGAQNPCGLDGTKTLSGGGAEGPTPVLLPEFTPARQVTMGNQHLCVLKTDGTVWCRGHSLATKTGIGTFCELVPIEFPE